MIEAKKFKAQNALMLVHSFCQLEEDDDEVFQDYCRFLKLFNAEGKMNSLVFGEHIGSIDLFFAWVKGEGRYLKV
jgi:hypothetical protein